MKLWFFNFNIIEFQNRVIFLIFCKKRLFLYKKICEYSPQSSKGIQGNQEIFLFFHDSVEVFQLNKLHHNWQWYIFYFLDRVFLRSFPYSFSFCLSSWDKFWYQFPLYFHFWFFPLWIIFCIHLKLFFVTLLCYLHNAV